MAVDTQNNGISGSGYVSENRTDEGLLKVHGVALGDNDVTIGAKSGERKLWRPEVLEESARLLEGKDIVADHENQSAYKTVGQVTDARYKDGVGVIYKGVVQDDELEPKIQHGWLDVSPKLIHSEEFDEISGMKAPTEIFDFPNLSIVRKGASPSNELNVGETDEFSVEELQDAFDDSSEGVTEYHVSSDGEEEELAKPEDVDYSRWMYDNKEGAQGATEKFPCGGIHKHEIEGEEWWMPCSSHDDFLEAWDEVNEDEMTEDEESEEGDSDEGEEEMEEDDEGEANESEELGYGEEYSKEEQRMASQLSSYSKLTKDESLGLISCMNPNRENDVESMSKMVAGSLGMHEDEMRKLMEEMSGYKKDNPGREEMRQVIQKYLSEEDSALNSVFS